MFWFYSIMDTDTWKLVHVNWDGCVVGAQKVQNATEGWRHPSGPSHSPSDHEIYISQTQVGCGKRLHVTTGNDSKPNNITSECFLFLFLPDPDIQKLFYL